MRALPIPDQSGLDWFSIGSDFSWCCHLKAGAAASYYFTEQVGPSISASTKQVMVTNMNPWCVR